MEVFDDIGNKSYEKSPKLEYSLGDHFSFAWKSISMLFKLTLILIQESIENLLTLVKGRKPKDISGWLALVTGGANGLGREIAFRLAQEKCNVVIVDLNLIEAQKTAEEIADQFKVKVAAFRVDVSNFDAIQQLKVEIEKSLGTVDILVNNAGILSLISLREGKPTDIQKLIDVNLTSHFWASLKNYKNP
jgi:all-trans-retinol dehydrogenase (NAD+)